MSELATLARPYASAVFKRAIETGTTGKWSGSLAFISAVLSERDVFVMLDNPKISKQDVLSFLLDICQGQVDEEAQNFLKLLVYNNRMTLISTILSLFEAYKADYEGYIDVEVSTAFEFSDEAMSAFAATLEKSLGKKIHINVILDKSLIGGVLVRAGDKVIDGSIRGQLQHMHKTLQ